MKEFAILFLQSILGIGAILIVGGAMTALVMIAWVFTNFIGAIITFILVVALWTTFVTYLEDRYG